MANSISTHPEPQDAGRRQDGCLSPTLLARAEEAIDRGEQGDTSTRNDRYVERKSPLMIASFVLLWFVSLALYGPRLWHVVAESRGVVEFVLLSAFGLLLVVFWMLAAYYLAVVVFSLFTRPLPSFPACPRDTWPSVALLYPTCNDFQWEAAASCVEQDYPYFHVFLLDDSDSEPHRALVDAFQAAHPSRTTVVRRPDHQGFKAGNLNYALHGAAADHPLFAVVDADERLPPDFLARAMVLMQNPHVAFVQANHAPNPEQKEAFARDIGATILPFWKVHCRPRNRYGVVLYLGHGAVVRRESWERVGGFPEVVLEDLAFSALLTIQGMQGLFLEDLLCYEDFPHNYLAFKRQQERYVIGTTQVLRRLLCPLLASPQTSLTEKIDFCLWCSPLYVPALCLLFILLCNVGLVTILGRWQTLTVSVFGHELGLPVLRVSDGRFALLSTWDFQLFSVFGAFAPAFGCLALGIKRKLHPANLLLLGTMPYLSLMLVSWRGILGYLVRGRTFSPPTGEAIAPSTTRHTNAMSEAKPWRAPRGWEVGMGLLLALASLCAGNIGHFGIGCCLLVGAYAEFRPWDSPSVRAASAGCFIAILLQMLLNTAMLGHSLGLAPLVFSVHF